MTHYFKDCKTLDEAKTLYRKLAMKMHPDRGGNKVEFQEMLNEFHAFRPGKEKFAGESSQWESFGPVYSSIIDQLLDIEGVVVEVVGSYIWIGGDTYSKRTQIKAVNTQGFMDCCWAKVKQKWFFKPSGYKPRSRKERSMDELRNMWGSTVVNKSSKRDDDKKAIN